MEEKKENKLQEFWNDQKYKIIAVGCVILAYQIGKKRGYNSALSVIDHTIDKFDEVIRF